jgi:tetratricopeptide (TPR) repeat protein
MGGVGKTALAAHIAYRLRPHFPDGVLWARLDTSDTMTILGAFADAYGRDVSRYTDQESRSQVVREVLANKRALIILDNARHSNEVAPLLPPTGACAVIVTTRHRDLSSTRFARRCSIGCFDKKGLEAFDLFSKVLGEERAQKDRAALAEIADLLGQLPLAVDIAASRLAYESNWSATEFLKRIHQERRRLDELDYEDLSVRVSFNLSHSELALDDQRFFAALGVFSGEDFGVDAVAYVLERASEEAQDHLRRLSGLSLIQPGRAGRYRLHPLLRDYARARATDPLVAQRMVEFYVSYVEIHERDYDCLELENSNLFAALDQASDQQMNEALLRGANAICHFLDTRGLYELAEEYLVRAQQAANKLEDALGAATVLLRLGTISRKKGEYARAKTYLQEGLAIALKAKQRKVTSDLLANLGTVSAELGMYDEAETYWSDSLVLARETNHREAISAVLQNLGLLADIRGDYEQAEVLFCEGLALARELGDSRRIGALLQSLAVLALNTGDYAQAERHLQDGRSLAREIGDAQGMSHILATLGAVEFLRGNYTLAEEYLREQLEQFGGIEYPTGASAVLTNLGSVLGNRGDYVQAEHYLSQGLALAHTAGHKENMCYALIGLGTIAVRQKSYARAEQYLTEALDLARALEHTELVSTALHRVGTMAARRGDKLESEEFFRESLNLARKTGQPFLTSAALNSMGYLYLELHRLGAASAVFQEALDIAHGVGAQEPIAYALYGQAQILATQGSVTKAQHKGKESLGIFETMGHYGTSEVGEWLASLPLEDPPQ